ncbi:hypothetical protein RP726_05210 [Candidatus Methylospira mobilis]|uniref:hypothetical protein n=1 Tax=Candidatus Methylospira mobilis TaxID=1808979 RepID=UPI0028EC311F|nr:hypothetical protein [Candidatus Methylospira mobilis]WNV05817.1 hypothetical protein RP726_05210 [Candidatus Methylospira mobilis]
MNILTDQEEEADALKKRFDTLKKEKKMGRAAFAKKFSVPGGDAMIYQHINGIRPMNMDAALAYIKGFGCTLEDLSPRLAREARKAASASTQDAHSDKITDPNPSLSADGRLIEGGFRLIQQEPELQPSTNASAIENDLLTRYRNAGAETRAAIDLLLLSKDERGGLKDEVLLSITRIELAAPVAMDAIKNRAA